MKNFFRLAITGLGLSLWPGTLASAQDPMAPGTMAGMAHDMTPGVAPSAMMIIPMMKTPMLPGMQGSRPKTTDWLPAAGIDPSTVPEARPRELRELKDGDTLDLTAMMVRRTVNGKQFVMYGYNGQYPGPLIKVKQNSTVHVRFSNGIDLPTTVHWHGLRLDNKFDGVPEVTQPEVPPGGNFFYSIKFPDAGIYWYHPHVREDIQQDMGLYGNMMVEPSEPGYYSPVNSEEVLMLDDLLFDGDRLVPFGKEGANFTIMGRFGTHLLVNGETHYHRDAKRGEVRRYFITNVSNTRTFNLNFGMPVKLVAGDVSRFEKELMVGSVVIAPAQRYVVEARYDKAGDSYITNNIVALDHMMGEFFSAVDTLGMVMVDAAPATPDHARTFATLRTNASVKAEIDRYRAEFSRPPDHELQISVEMKDLPIIMLHFISIDTIFRSPVEFTDTMSDMNWIATSREVRWVLKDRASGKENMDIDLQLKQGTTTKIRIVNDPKSFHPMNHPMHLHGQRMLVVARDGEPVTDFAWADTVLIPVGQTADILVENSNPGKWMLHCHIAEHLDAGMMTVLTVNP